MASGYEIPSDAETYQLPLHNRNFSVIPKLIVQKNSVWDQCMAK